MNSPFFKESKKIADQFIQSILFVDDEIYPDPKIANRNNNLDGETLVRVFSKERKLCALNNPQTEDDLLNVIDIAKQADVTILDWRLNLDTDIDPQDEEKDIEGDDPRGRHTLKLIDALYQNQGKSLKLILIYTGETGLRSIVDSLEGELGKIGFRKISDRSFESDFFRVTVAGKPILSTTLRHGDDLKDWIVTYEEVPNFILNEFTAMTSGLVSNFALSCLNVIRNNNFRILELFNKNLDPAFLGHKIVLSDQNDAEEFLVELMKDSIGDLLHYNKAQFFINKDLIKAWIIDKNFGIKKFLNKDDKPYSDAQGKSIDAEFTLTDGFVETSLFGEQDDVSRRLMGAFDLVGLKSLTGANKSDFINTIQKKGASIFVKTGEDYNAIDSEFAKLTHHRNLFKPSSYHPKLTLGTVIMGVRTKEYWVCIQQRCDSVRLKKDQTRRFLFLPLQEVKGKSLEKFNFITPDNIKLKEVNKSYEIRTIKFRDTEGDGLIKAYLNVDDYFFKPEYSKISYQNTLFVEEEFKWVFDLKELHAQRVANTFSSQISRVGLNESEWLRRWAT